MNLLLQKAKVDKKAITEKLASIFKSLKEKNKKEYYWSLDEGMGIHWRSAQVESSSTPAPAAPITHILSAPFNDRDTSAIGEEDLVDLEEGKYQAFTTGIMLMSTSRENGIGHFFSPLSTHNRIKITGSVSNAEVSLFAMGYVGVSSASAKSMIKIEKNGRTICESEFDHGSVLAVVAWLSEEEHGDQFSINCSIRSTDNDELNTSLTTKVSTLTAGGGASSAEVKTNVRKLEIKYFNN
ncbi:MAG: hypothetical protein AB7I27_08295 [Bacteriovoracaceae bacterium]